MMTLMMTIPQILNKMSMYKRLRAFLSKLLNIFLVGNIYIKRFIAFPTPPPSQNVIDDSPKF